MQGNPRHQRYFSVSSQIAGCDTAEIQARLETGKADAGWGRHQVLEIGDTRVFVKRVPVTTLEAENLFSTRNLYDIPTYYNYGVGSAGFNVFRELVTHIKTTNWVLSGAIENFPLLYHYRLVPLTGKRPEVDQERHDQYVAYWGGNENIGRYMRDRVNAPHELLLFLEHLPRGLHPWLGENPDRTDWVLEELRKTITFLREHNIVHFDAHFGNILTDGERVYLTDFGLVLDKSFPLTAEEEAFFDANTLYDYGAVLASLDGVLHAKIEALKDEGSTALAAQYGLKPDLSTHEQMPIILQNLEAIAAGGLVPLEETYLRCLLKYREINLLMNAFYRELARNNQKDTPFPHANLQHLLKETGFH